MIAAIVLAAGKSTRMGQLKLLLPVGGRSMIRTVVESALRSKVDQVVVVLGNEAHRVRPEVESAAGEMGDDRGRLQTVENPRFEGGQSTSLQAGLSAVDRECEGVLVLMGDQPFVGPDIIDELIERFRVSGAALVIPHYSQGRASPMLFARDLFPELMAVVGDKGGREVAARHASRAVIVEVQSSQAGQDIDTWEDYQEYSGKGAE
ncbi:MAG: molybdenum cofactor cytidylyltransferase [Chloroflexi bacterium]|nr:molybdenum cofactor cytidylyltransferase [Chloroflexota bacterium]